MMGQDIENLSRMRAVRTDCFGSGSKVMTPSGPVLLPPSARVLVGEEGPVFIVGLPVDESLALSSGVDSDSEGDPGES